MITLHDYILEDVKISDDLVKSAQDPTKGHFENGKAVNWHWGRLPTPEEKKAIDADVEFRLAAAQVALTLADENPLTLAEIGYFRQTEQAYGTFIGDLPRYVAIQDERKRRLSKGESHGKLLDEKVEVLLSGWSHSNKRANVVERDSGNGR